MNIYYQLLNKYLFLLITYINTTLKISPKIPFSLKSNFKVSHIDLNKHECPENPKLSNLFSII